jgi:hypothetical protein
MYRIRRLFHPEIFQGKYQKKGYFEGWYFKCVDESTKNVVAFIPGVSYGESPKDSHSFIQVLDAARNRSGYFSFPLSAFKYDEQRLKLHIGKNSFSTSGLTVSLKNKEMSYKGSLSFQNQQPYPKTFLNPGIMGPFGFLTFMECYHGVVNVQHGLSGWLIIDEQPKDFLNGKGYIEKDWGTSFPDAWVWVQCNHFENKNASFMLSYAHIPFLGTSFNGIIAFLSVDNKFYRFSTYGGAHVTSLGYDNGILSILAENRHYVLNLTVTVKPGSQLKAPKKGAMTNTIVESMTSQLNLYLIDKKGRIVFEGTGNITGVEVSGDLDKLY